MKIFPNPASAKEPITVFLDQTIQGLVRIDLLDRDGSCVYRQVYCSAQPVSSLELRLAPMPSGLYILRLVHDGHSALQRLLLQ
ncbi:MAG: T9SS type A sorting domain-containing protein [Saprospiraceae bacterium]|nr:T9SS type A sorting domain-containing protein [Saprospiraceae bacterium]MCB0626594.1 T9SS type A sorting domain-containing protein [Saprospiraceae bacterium]MCB0675088.1 T9SS type A sorting domain-containing protein [Saprospiraceae bacterium]MCB0681986.1 T9SS type A sorting domain-containing protein [Saprospiraceae bacterium]